MIAARVASTALAHARHCVATLNGLGPRREAADVAGHVVNALMAVIACGPATVRLMLEVEAIEDDAAPRTALAVRFPAGLSPEYRRSDLTVTPKALAAIARRATEELACDSVTQLLDGVPQALRERRDPVGADACAALRRRFPFGALRLALQRRVDEPVDDAISELDEWYFRAVSFALRTSLEAPAPGVSWLLDQLDRILDASLPSALTTAVELPSGVSLKTLALMLAEGACLPGTEIVVIGAAPGGRIRRDGPRLHVLGLGHTFDVSACGTRIVERRLT